MSIRNLQFLFDPASVAIIGASERPHSVGATVLANMLADGYKGDIYAVNPKYRALSGRPVYRDVASLPKTPDLAIVCTPPHTVPGLIAALGERGTHAAIVLTAGLGTLHDSHGVSLKQRMLDAARPSLLRILGPNCVGMMVPGIGLNASFAHIGAVARQAGFRLAVRRARDRRARLGREPRGIGFSHLVSLGEHAPTSISATCSTTCQRRCDPRDPALYRSDHATPASSCRPRARRPAEAGAS